MIIDIYRKIPGDADIVLTHTPPYRTLDKTRKGSHAGCRQLEERMNSKALRGCKLHVFGHIHEAYGGKIVSSPHGHRVAVNAAMPRADVAIIVDLPNECQ